MILTNRLGSTFELPLTMSWTKVNHSIQIESERLTGDGSIFTGSSIEPRSFTVDGSLYYKTKSANRTKIDELKHFLKYAPIEVNRGDDKNIIAYPNTFDAEYLDDDVEVILSIGFTALDPYFYGAIQSFTSTLTAPDSIAIEPLSEAYPVITLAITGTCTDPTLSCDGQTIVIAGEYTTGTIIVDCKRMRATYEGVGIIGAMNDAWLNSSFILTQDSTSVAFTATGSYTVDVTIDFRPRWL